MGRSIQGTSLARRLEATLRRMWSDTHLKVAILGPGGLDPARPDYDKRLHIRDDLRSRLPQDTFLLPEDVIAGELKAEFGLGPAEARLVDMCDVILALIPPDHTASGVFFELADFVHLPGFAEKVRIFRPESSVQAWRSYREDRIYGMYDVTRFIDYPDDTWWECSFIKLRAIELIDSERRRLLNVNLTARFSE